MLWRSRQLLAEANIVADRRILCATVALVRSKLLQSPALPWTASACSRLRWSCERPAYAL